jgi:CRP-like cAMP-binding protein
MIGNNNLVGHLLSAGARRLRRSRGTIIYHQDDEALSIYYIERGSVDATVLTDAGRPFIVDRFNDGDFFGEESLIENAQYACSNVTSSSCEFLELSGRTLRDVLKEDNDASDYLTAYLIKRKANIQNRLLDVMFNTTEQRLAHTLASLSRPQHDGVSVITGFTHEMLAELVGTTRTRITFFMNKFRRMKLIDYRGGVITIRPELLRHIQPSHGHNEIGSR